MSVDLVEQSRQAAGDVTQLRRRVQADPADHQARFDLATALFARGLAENRRSTSSWRSSAAIASGTMKPRASSWFASDAPGPAHGLTRSGPPPPVLSAFLMSEVEPGELMARLLRRWRFSRSREHCCCRTVRMPLHIFEPRYRNMIEEALGNERMLGMIQPRGSHPHPVPDDAQLFGIGCAGRIVSFAETEDGRFVITLRGVCRFRVTGELPPHRGFRRVRLDFASFQGDLQPASEEGLTGHGCWPRRARSC